MELTNKVGRVLDPLPKVFAWAREAHPKQPLTNGVWQGRVVAHRPAFADDASSA